MGDISRTVVLRQRITCINKISDLDTEQRIQKIFDSKKPSVVIFPVSHAVGLSVIRALEDESIPIIALDNKLDSADRKSVV